MPGLEKVAALIGGKSIAGNYLDSLDVELGAFGIPPNELDDILPQHLLMLEVAAGALDDAHLPRRAERPRMGCVVGMAFDLEDTNFHLRWQMPDQVGRWRQKYGLEMTSPHHKPYVDELLSNNTYRLFFGDDIDNAVGLLDTLIA